MKHFLLFALTGALFLALPLQGQNHTACSTPPPSKALVFDDYTIDRGQSANPFVVQIFVHILRNDDGSNAAMSDNDLKTNLDRMAAFFRPHNICFTFVGRDFIDNTTWNTNFTGGLIGALHAVNPHTDAIDIYVHKNGFDNSGGNAYNIPSDKCSVAASASFNFEHEMGHCLGLLHTFETANGTECPDASNCGSAGDLVCDTPADFAGSENSSMGCTYTGNTTINCNGNSFGYNPPTTNIMSYWASCYSNFSLDQASRMRNTINSTAFLQDRLTPVDVIISGVTITDEIAVGAQNSIQIGNISSSGDVAINGAAQGIFNAGSFIQVVPGTEIVPTGVNSVLLMINTLCDGLLAKSESPGEARQLAAQPAPIRDKIDVYPNPFTDRISIQVTFSKAEPGTLRLFDFSGNLIQSIDCQELAKTGNYYEEVMLPELMPGMYFLRLYRSEGMPQTVKLVKAD